MKPLFRVPLRWAPDNIPDETSVHAPRTATAGLEQEPTDEDLAELDMAMENAGLEPQTPASSEPEEIPEVKVNNQSGLDFDLNAMLQNPKTITADDDGPQVLVYHTHATEAYTPSGSDTYEASGDARTLDTNQNVVRVGTELCKVLEERGIKTVHLTDLNDYPSYNGSYGESLRNVQAALEKISHRQNDHRRAPRRHPGRRRHQIQACLRAERPDGRPADAGHGHQRERLWSSTTGANI